MPMISKQKIRTAYQLQILRESLLTRARTNAEAKRDLIEWAYNQVLARRCESGVPRNLSKAA